MGDFVEHTEWSEVYDRPEDYLEKKMRNLATDEFRIFLLETGVVEGCRQYRERVIPCRDRSSYNNSRRVYFFCSYINLIVEACSITGRKDLLDILFTEQELPLDFYYWEPFGFNYWIENGDVESFRRYFLTHPLLSIRGHIERKIAKSGMTDILDFFLSFEDEGTEHVLSSDIMGWACYYRNVDILDRILAKGYSVNATLRLHGVPQYPAAIIIKHDNRDDTTFVDRLIMYGANFRVPLHNRDISFMNLGLLYRDEAYIKRLLDIGIEMQADDYPNLFGVFMHAEEDLEVDIVIRLVMSCDNAATRRRAWNDLHNLQVVNATAWKGAIMEKLRPLLDTDV